MRRIVGLREMLEIEMGVDLSRGDARMPQHLLHGAQVAARLENVRRKGVPQNVRMDFPGEAELDGPVAQARLHRARSEPPAAAPYEERASPVVREGLALRQPRPDRRESVAADGNDAGLVALAGDAHGRIAQVDAVKIEP